MSLFLVGMRAVGKSTTGRACASRLGVPFIDTDEEVERRSGRPIADWFAAGQQGVFRRMEREVVLDVTRHPGHLVATGAGAVLEPSVRAALSERGLTVWLRADVELLRRRMRATPRPSLTGADPADEVPSLLAVRDPLYMACSHAQIEVTSRSVAEVVDELERLWTVFAHHDVR